MAETAIAPAARFYCACGSPVTGRSPYARVCLECMARLADCPRCPSKAASEGLPACSRHLESELGITYRQLDYWTRRGYLRPERRANSRGHGPASGVNRVWPADEVEIVRRMERLTRAGVVPAVAAVYARDSWPAGEIAPGLVLSVTEEASRG